jgi:hypothetical protein
MVAPAQLEGNASNVGAPVPLEAWVESWMPGPHMARVETWVPCGGDRSRGCHAGHDESR